MDTRSLTEQKAGEDLLRNLQEGLEAEARRCLAETGRFTETEKRKLSSQLGDWLAGYLYRNLAGQQVYVPKGGDKRDAMLYDDFDGKNYLELAHRYGLTDRWVRAILAREREKRHPSQLTLFEAAQ
jgi:Mor family transcriptional regulator